MSVTFATSDTNDVVGGDLLKIAAEHVVYTQGNIDQNEPLLTSIHSLPQDEADCDDKYLPTTHQVIDQVHKLPSVAALHKINHNISNKRTRSRKGKRPNRIRGDGSQNITNCFHSWPASQHQTPTASTDMRMLDVLSGSSDSVDGGFQMYFDFVNNTSNPTTTTKDVILSLRHPKLDRQRQLQASRERTPPILCDIEKHIHSELACLQSQRNHISAYKYMDARLTVFRECARSLIEQFKTYGPLLSKVLREFEHYVKCSKIQRTEAVRATEELRTRNVQLSAEISKILESKNELEERKNNEIKQIQQIMREGKTFCELSQELDRTSTKLVEQEGKNAELHKKLTQTGKLKSEFDRTIQAIEETFSMINDNKELTIHRLQERLTTLNHEMNARDAKHSKVLSDVTDEREELLSEVRVAKSRLDMAQDRLRQNATHIGDLKFQNEELQQELDELDSRLQKYGDDSEDSTPSSSQVIPKGKKPPVALMEQACRIIPDLGDPKNYHSLEQVLQTILQIWELTMQGMQGD